MIRFRHERADMSGMKATLGLVCAAAFLLAAGCAPAVNLDQERAGLLERDRAWSSTLGDPDAFASFLDKDASFLVPNMPEVKGAAAFRDTVAGMASTPGFELRWSASKADVGAAGDLGYTQGTYEMTLPGADGSPATEKGKYITVWKKHPGGEWMVVADIFNADTPPPAPQAPAAPEGA